MTANMKRKTVALLEAIDVSSLADGTTCWVESEQTVFRYSAADPGTGGVHPTSGPGVWLFLRRARRA